MKHTRRLRRWFGCAAVALVLAAGAGGADADGVKRVYQVRDTDKARFDAIEFRRHANLGQWRQAILKLQQLLDTPPSLGVVMEIEGSRPVARFESVRHYAEGLFASLPPEGRDAWEQIERRFAEELLARGLRLRREEDLAAAARRYPHRDVRRRAHEALAQLALARGDFDRAARELEDLLEVADERERPGIFARIAFAHAQVGDAEGLADAEARAAGLAASQVPGPGGVRTVSLGEFLATMRRAADAAAPRFAGARQFGGDRHGTGRSEPPPRVEGAGWTAESGFLSGEENDEQRAFPPDALFNPVRPVIAQGTVFINDGRNVTARELGSGAERWRHEGPYARSPEWRDNPAQLQTATVADGVVYAAIATGSDHPDMQRTAFGKRIVYSLPHRVLHALDARSGQVLWSHDRSQLAGRADSAELDRESVASPPLVVGDDVIVSTWAYNGRYEVRLVCFDRRNGATRWRTSLVHGQQEMNLFGRPVKELVTSALAEQSGLVYLATGIGVVAAVDRVTGGVEWITEYEQSEIPTTYQWFETNDRKVTWRPSPVAATRTAVVVAPADSPELSAYHPLTGQRLWNPIKHAARTGQDGSWFLGVQDGRVYVLGWKLTCYDLATGREAWTEAGAGRLAPEGRDPRPPLGAGLLTPQAVHVPTEAGVAEVDPATGKCRELRPLPRPARRAETGRRSTSLVAQSLVSGDGALCVVSKSWVDCYYDFAVLRDRLLARLRQNPEDPFLRLEAGEVFRAAERFDEAVASFDEGLRAAERVPGRPRETIVASLHRSLHETLLARAKRRRASGDVQGSYDDLQRAADVAVSPEGTVRALFALSEALQSGGRPEQARAALRRIADRHADLQISLGEDEEPSDAGALALFRMAAQAELDRRPEDAVDLWFQILERRPDAMIGPLNASAAVRESLTTLAVTATPAVRRKIADRSRVLLDAARATKDAGQLVRLSRTLPDEATAAEAALEAARIHAAAGRAREAAAVLEGLLAGTPPPTTSARALAALAEAYRALDETARERSVLRRMIADVPNERLAEGATAGEVAKRELEAERFRDETPALPAPKLPLALRWESMGTGLPMVQMLQVQGTLPRGAEDTMLLHQDGLVSLVAAATGVPRWKVVSNVDQRTAFGARGHFVLVGGDMQAMRVSRIEALRATDGRRLWARIVPGTYVSSTSALGVVYVLVQGRDEDGGRITRLTSFSAESGDAIAEAQLPAHVTGPLVLAADALVVVEQLTQGESRRRIHTLDATTLLTRGTVDVDGYTSSIFFRVPETNLVVTTARGEKVVAVDVAKGGLAWAPVQADGKQVKNVLGVPGGIVVTDHDNGVRKLDAATGKQLWVRSLASMGKFTWLGETAEGDLVIATVAAEGAAGGAEAFAVGIDAATGEVRWRTKLPLEGSASAVTPTPRILTSHVSYEINESRRFKVVLFDRATGAVAATVKHPGLAETRQIVQWSGPWLVLMAPASPDMAVYGGPAESPK